jgi:uncharacterized RDD family membrane protein YckC
VSSFSIDATLGYNDAVRYAGFWRRLAAGLIDIVVVVPWMAFGFWAMTASKLSTLLLMLPVNALGLAYPLVLHARFGQTLGKMATGVRVTKPSGEPISWREAGLRSSVDIVLTVIGMASYATMVARLPDVEWQLGWIDHSERLSRLQPEWGRWAGYLGQVWFWSEMIVLLFNDQKRALHDFIAGTVVIHTRAAR